MNGVKKYIAFGLLCMVLILCGCGQEEPEVKVSADPAHSTIAVVVGTTSEQIAETNYPEATILKFDALSDSVAALQSGKAEFVVTAYSNCVNFARNQEGLTILDEQLSSEPVAIAVNKSETELLEAISGQIEKYRAEGILDDMEKNWIRTDGSDYVIPEIQDNTEGPELNIAISADREPLCFVYNGEYTGMDVELARRICKDLGYKPVFKDMKFSAMIPSVLSGKTPIAISNITATEERKESVNFSPDYFFNPQMLLTRSELIGDASNEVTLEGKTADGAGEKSFWTALKASYLKTFVREQRWKLILSGIGVTLLISLCASVLGSILGFGVCMLRRNRKKVPSIAAKVFIRVIQGTPIVVLLMILYYAVLNKTGLDGVTVAIIAFSINFAAYACEILRTGIEAVDPGQREAAAAIGFSNTETFLLITLPQAARHFLPVLKGEFISLVKMTSVVGYVAVQDLTKASDIIRSRTYEAFFPLIVTALLYFLLTWVLASFLTMIEFRTDPKVKKRALQKKNAEKGGDAA